LWFRCWLPISHWFSFRRGLHEWVKFSCWMVEIDNAQHRVQHRLQHQETSEAQIQDEGQADIDSAYYSNAARLSWDLCHDGVISVFHMLNTPLDDFHTSRVKYYQLYFRLPEFNVCRMHSKDKLLAHFTGYPISLDPHIQCTYKFSSCARKCNYTRSYSSTTVDSS